MKIFIRFFIIILMVMLGVVCYSASVGNIKLSCRDFYIKGCNIPITVEYTVDSMKSLYIGNDTNLPDFVAEELIDAKGQVLQYSNKYYPGPPILYEKVKAYPLKKGMKMLFTRNISDQYKIIDSGEYKYLLSVIHSGKKQILAETTIKIIDTVVQSKYTNTDIKGIEMSIVKIDDKNLNNWCLKCEKKDVYNLYAKKNTFYDVMTDTVIVNVVMDFNNNLWIVLENKGKYELLLWNQILLEYQVLIPWGEKEIKIGTTDITISKLPFVLAGREGEPWFTSSSISPLHSTYIE